MATGATIVRIGQAGLAAAKAEDFVAACAKFKEAHELSPHVGYVVNLARCEARLHKVLLARTHWKQALELAKAVNDPRIADVEEGLAAHERTVPHLKIRWPARLPEGATASLDGEPVAIRGPTDSVAVDPGHHVIDLMAPGCETAHVAVETPIEGTTVVLGALACASKAPPVDQVAVKPAPPHDTATGSGNTQRWLGLGGMVVGGLGLGTAGLLAWQASKTNNEANLYCSGPSCDDLRGPPLREDALRFGNYATGFAIGGGAFAVAGAVLYFTARRPAVLPVAGLGNVGVVGTF
jgi:hypothetical protein